MRTSTAVSSAVSLGPTGPVALTTADGACEQYDAVLLATHSDISLRILGEGGPQVCMRVVAVVVVWPVCCQHLLQSCCILGYCSTLAAAHLLVSPRPVPPIPIRPPVPSPPAPPPPCRS